MRTALDIQLNCDLPGEGARWKASLALGPVLETCSTANVVDKLRRYELPLQSCFDVASELVPDGLI